MESCFLASLPTLVLFASALHGQQTPPVLSREMRGLLRTEASIIVLRHVTLFDGTGTPPRHDQSVVIAHGRISSVGPDRSVVVPSGATVLDESGKTLLPGLVGMHEHLFYPNVGKYILATVLGESAPRMYLSAGITTARTAGSIAPVTDLAIKRLIQEGKQAGPDLDLTGPYLDGSGTDFLPNQVLTSPEDARETVDYWTKRGITSFKAYQHIAPENLAAAIKAAHSHGLKMTGHLCSVRYKEAIAMGIDNLEHGLTEASDLNPAAQPGICPGWLQTTKGIAEADVHGPAIQSLIHELITHNVAITSTLAVEADSDPEQPSLQSLDAVKAAMSSDAWNAYLVVRKELLASPESIKEMTKRVLHTEMAFEREFVRQGGLLMAGADPTGAGDTVPGLADEHQMELLIEAGFSPEKAVSIYSQNGAVYLGRATEIGTIEKGKRADLLLLNGDFEHDRKAIEKPEIVFKGGIAWESEKLRQSVLGLTGER